MWPNIESGEEIASPEKYGFYTTGKPSGFVINWKSKEKKIMNNQDSAVAVYGSHEDAEAAVKELEKAGFDMQKLSIVGRDYHTDEHVVGYYSAGDRMKYWGGVGAFWGWIWGLLFGSAFFFIPGMGPLIVACPLVGWIISALEGAVVVGGLSAIGAGLVSLGIPKESVLKYETALKAEKFLLIAHGTPEEVKRAKEILDGTKSETLNEHAAPASEAGVLEHSSV